MFLQIGLQILLPAFLLISLWRSEYTRRSEWLLNVFAVSAALLFVFLTARWDFTSYYLRFALPVLLAAAAYASYRRTTRSQEGSRKPKLPGLIAITAVLIIFSSLSVIALWGLKAPEGALQLAYPLRGATYYIGGGGNSRFINGHQASESQKFALDILRLNTLGNRASGLAPDDLQRYPIFGDTVYSPCSGTVLRAVDELEDLRPPEMDLENVAGNHVVLACQGFEVVLAHLKQGSIPVTSGMEVIEGEVIGQVGNSGKTTQPHLHLHAERGDELEEIFNGEGVPIELDGRFLVRNSLFNGR